MSNISMYFHGGSANHGCEAIVRSTSKICKRYTETEINLFSFAPNEDKSYKVIEIPNIFPVGFRRYSFSHIFAVFKHRILQDEFAFDEQFHKNLWKYSKIGDIALSIGGDNYCYGNYPTTLATINKKLNKEGIKTVLWGCSIEEDLLKNVDIVNDMSLYSLITARESISYNALLDAGVNRNTKLYPDPAFTLEKLELTLPYGFIEKKTIGINMSPLVQKLEQVKNAVFDNYLQLIKYIIEQTDNNVALIPHVVCKNNNDLKPLTQLYNEFKPTGRVILIQDCNCMQLKGFISRCRIFIGARTHATIAAYSTCVPTLVLGYSIKAKGIAKDIFGNYENYVIPVQSLQYKDDLVNAFKWLMQNEDKIRQHLHEFMPDYIAKAWQAGKEIKRLIERKTIEN